MHSIDGTFFARIPAIVSRHRIVYAAVLAAATAAMALGIPRLTIDMSTESFFLQNDPAKAAYQRFRDLFGSDEFLFVVYRAKDGDLFSERSLSALADIHQTIVAASRSASDDPGTPLGRITDVTSLINVNYLEADAHTLRAKDFVADQPTASAADRAALKARALAHPRYVPSLLNRRGDFAVIILETDLGTTRADDGMDVAAMVEDGAFEDLVAAEQTESEFIRPRFWDYQTITNAVGDLLEGSDAARHLTFFPVGNPVIMKFFGDVLTTEVTLLTLASFGLIVFVFYLLFRSVRSVLTALAIVTAAIVWTLGICGWIGAAMTLMITVIIFLTLSVGVADAVHLLSGYMYLRCDGMDHRAAVGEVFRTSGPACLLTSLTTMIGLLSLLVIPIVPLRVFGAFAGLGVFLAFVFTLLILPLSMPADGIRKRDMFQGGRPHRVQRMLRWMEPLVYRAPLAVSIGFFTLSALFAWGVTMIRIDTNFGQLINTRNPVRQHMDTVEANIGGTQNMEVLVETGTADGLKDPRILTAMADLQSYMESGHGQLVVSTYSLADAVREAFRALNEDRPAMYAIPETRPMLAQTLLLFEGAAPEDRAKLVTDDYASARISARIRNRGTDTYIPLMDDISSQIDRLFGPLKAFYPDLTVSVTGVFALAMKLADFVSWSQIKSFSLALAVISVLFVFVFRSVKGGLISIVPNLFPILAAFGTMGFMGYALDLDTLLVAPIAIGIAVDDTIHFLTRYRIEQSQGAAPKTAVKHAFREVGQAMVFTSTILSAGFLIFTFCQHNGLSHFGLLSATAIVAALVSDLFFLPRLCLLTHLTFDGSSRVRRHRR